jgi:hypothetical protein
MTDKDLKLLKKISRNRIVICIDYILLAIVWLTAIGYYASLGPHKTDQIIPTALSAVLVFDIVHRKRELYLYNLIMGGREEVETNGKPMGSGLEI